MENTTLKATMIKGYNEHSFTHNYIFGFSYKGIVYMTHATADVLPYILKLDKASRGAGYALRFKPTNEQKTYLLARGAKAICSTNLFDDMVSNSIYNRGEIFEKLVTEEYGQTWVKDNVPFYMDGDLTVKSTAYQIKFEKATFINEKQLMNLKNRG